MFSDIQSTCGKVEIYGVGRLFEKLEWGVSYAYEGTIAQDIERFCLESLTVEDTLDSIKSIDWAMFIPCGVRSYFAKPFYSAEGLLSVLIFASDTPGDAMMNEASFRHLYEPFSRLAMRWRSLKAQCLHCQGLHLLLCQGGGRIHRAGAGRAQRHGAERRL